jgi:outer membrane protein assembly factor BamB
VVGTVRAEDWPQWLGPRRDGSSNEKITPWKEAPKVLWREKVSEGHTSPIVADGKVFLHTRAGNKDAEEITAYDAVKGTKLWSETYDRAKFSSRFGVGPRATPLVHNRKLYTFGVTGILSCWDLKGGKPLWTVDTAKEFNPKQLFFGVSSSPIVDDNKLIVQVGAKGACIVAFDLDSGKVLWKNGDDPASYASPIAFTQSGQRQVLFLTSLGLRSFNPGDGKLLWETPFKDLLNESSTTPVRVDDFILASSVTAGSLAVQLKDENQKLVPATLWKSPTLSCYFSTPIPVGKDHIYLITKSLFDKHSILRCIERKTGKELWKKPDVAEYHAALLRTADDKLLMLDDFGNLKLLDPDPKEYRELATAKVCRPTWAHPALSEGRVYLRDDSELICVQVSNSTK